MCIESTDIFHEKILQQGVSIHPPMPLTVNLFWGVKVDPPFLVRRHFYFNATAPDIKHFDIIDTRLPPMTSKIDLENF